MDKDKWMADKVKRLIDEGKSQDQAVAIANSMWDDLQKTHEKALADALEEAYKRDIPQSERDKLEESDFAGPHQSFPIQKPEDVAAAAHSLGRAGGNQDAIKAAIIRIAKRKGAAFVAQLPDAWKDDESNEKPGAPDEAEKSLTERIWDRISERLGRTKDPTPSTSGFHVFKDASGQDRWLAFFSNNFEDREHEFFSEKGFDRYVKRLDMGIVPMPKLRSWHVPGTEYGQADWVDRIGHFHVATGTYDDTPAALTAKQYDKDHADEYGVSHGLLYKSRDKQRVNGKNVYKDWNTFEVSPLPHHRAANDLTAFAVEKDTALKEAEMDQEKRKHLVAKFGEEYVAKLETATEERGKELEAMRAYKDFVNPIDPEKTTSKEEQDATDKALADLLPELIGADAETASMTTALAGIVKEQSKTIAELKSYIDKQKALKPKRASQAEETELDEDDEKDAEIIHQINQENADAKAAKAFPGLYDHTHGIDKAAKAQFEADAKRGAV